MDHSLYGDNIYCVVCNKDNICPDTDHIHMTHIEIDLSENGLRHNNSTHAVCAACIVEFVDWLSKEIPPIIGIGFTKWSEDKMKVTSLLRSKDEKTR